VRTAIVCGALMVLGIATAEGAQSFHSANRAPGCKFLVAGAMGKTCQRPMTWAFARERSPPHD
jgi:hypothetical protein